MTIPEAIQEYKKNMNEAEKLTEALFTKKDMNEWITALHKRAERLTDLYKRDNELLDFITKEIEIVEGSAMDDAFEALYDLYLDGYDDAPLMIAILKRMEKYYTSKSDYEKIVVSYSIHAYESHEYISRINPTVPLDMSLYQGILDLKDHYAEVTRPRVRWNFFVTYFNIICAAESIPGLCPDEVFKYLLEAEEFWKSKTVQDLDKDNEDVVETIDDIEKGFLVYSEKYQEMSPKIQEELYRRSLLYIDKDDLYKSEFLPFFAYNRCLCEKGEITKKELLERFEIYFKPKILHFFDEEINDERITSAFEEISSVLGCLSLPGEADIEHYYGIIKKFFRDVEAKTKLKRLTPYINTIIADFVVHSLPFEKNKEEIEQTLFDNLIKRQAPTYIHSVMVMKIAETIYEYMDKSLLKGIDKPLEYIQNSALLHDIGKSMITVIINMQRRKLSDDEFLGIKNHPTFGANIIKENSLLKEYYDVIIGHHKWYDGSNGYPMDFDNTKSKYKIVIDLITIADCLDAATDRFGRNYKNPKSVREVVEEFKKEAGSKYSPYFANLLDNSIDLIHKLEVLTQYERPEYMYLAYIKGKIQD